MPLDLHLNFVVPPVPRIYVPNSNGLLGQLSAGSGDIAAVRA